MSTSIALVLLSIAALPAQSVNPPLDLKTEVFAGFSTTTLKPGRLGSNDLDAVRLNGWNFSTTSYAFFRRWGLTAEASGYGRDKSPVDATTQIYLFGGTFRAVDKRRFALTGRIRAGVNRWRPNVLPAGGDSEQTGLAFGFGQSLDLKINENIALRVQPELLLVRRESPDGKRRSVLTNPLSLGLVFKFGNR